MIESSSSKVGKNGEFFRNSGRKTLLVAPGATGATKRLNILWRKNFRRIINIFMCLKGVTPREPWEIAANSNAV